MKNTLLLLLCTIHIVLFAQWKPMTGAKGGAVQRILSDGSNHMIATSPYGGSHFYSTDDGQTWQLKKRVGSQYAIMVWNGHTVHVDKDSNIVINYNMSGADVLLSSFFRQNGIAAMGIHFINRRFYANTPLHVYYSDDTCASWHPITAFPNGVVAGNETMLYLYSYQTMKVYRSYNNGNTWDSITVGSNVNIFACRDTQIAYHSNVGTGLRYSANAGNTFTFVNTVGFISGYITSYAIADSLVYIGTEGTNAGVYFYNPSTGNKGKLHLTNVIDSIVNTVYYKNGKLWIGTECDGIYCYDESTHITTKVLSDVYAYYATGIAVSDNKVTLRVRDGTTFFQGTWNGVIHSDNYGTTFANLQSSLKNIWATDAIGNYIYYVRSDTAFATYLYRKTTNGSEQAVSNISFVSDASGLFHTDSALFMVSGKLYRSTDTGLTWDTVSAGTVTDFKLNQDSIYLLIGNSVHVFDKTGVQAYTKNMSLIGMQATTLAVTDSALFVCNGNTVSRGYKHQNFSLTLTTAGAFQRSKISALGAFNNHVYLDIDSAGVFILPPGATSWAWFSQGLYPFDAKKFAFNDSMVYAITDNGNWVWCRNLNQLKFNTITGSAFIDNNNNNIPENTDIRLPNTLIKATNCGSFAVTDAQGNYTLISECDTNQVELFNIIPYTLNVNPQQHTVINSDTGRNFALHTLPGVNDLQVFVSQVQPTRRGANRFYITALNVGTTTLNARVMFIIPPNLRYMSNTFPTPSALVVDTFWNTPDTIVWNLPSFTPNNHSQIMAFLWGDTTLQLDETVQYKAIIEPITGDTTPVNNIYIINDTVITTAPYDPNNKTVNPVEYTANHYQNGVALHYTITFQNIGSGPTSMVHLLDTLSNLLDLRSIRIIASSHPCELEVTGNTLRFIFNPCILAPDSVNEAESIGFVSFTIMPVQGLSNGNTIPNNAAIYFDYLAPIITNTAEVIFLEPTYIAENKDRIPVSIAPNPAYGYTVISIGSTTGFELEIVTLTGQPVQKQTTGETSLTVNTSGMAAGIYFYKITIAGKPAASGKMIIVK